MTKSYKKQPCCTIAKKSLFIINKYNLNIEEIRCYDCNSKLLNLIQDSDSNVVECKCRKCKSLNYFEHTNK